MRRIAFALSVVLGWGLPHPVHAAEAQRIKIGLDFVNSRAAVLWICQEQGLCAKEGIEAEVIRIRGGTAAAQAVTSGQIQLSLSGTISSFPAIAAGSDIVELMNFEPVVSYLLVGNKEITSPAELKGKLIGVSGLGLSSSSLAVRLALKHFGLDPTRDQITLVATGNQTERVMAVVSGNVAATVLAEEFQTKAEQSGTHVLVDLRTLGIPWAGSNLVTTRRYLQTHRDTVDRVMKAFLRSIAFIRDPQNKLVVLGVLKEKLKLEGGISEEVYRDLLRYYLVPKPYPNLASIQSVLREAATFVPQVSKLKAEEVAALEPLKALDQSGWIDSLYRTGGK